MATSTSARQQLPHAGAQLGGGACGGNTGLLEGRVLAPAVPVATGDDNLCLAHVLAARRGHSSDVGDHWLGRVGLDVLGRRLARPPDLPDQDRTRSPVIGLEQLQAGDEIESLEGIATNADADTMPKSDWNTVS